MEPDKAQKRVTEMIKGLATGLWRRQTRSLDQSQAEEHTAFRCWTKAGMEPHHKVKENVALVQLPSGKVSVVHI